ncbi:hypothetical protein F5B22DRAFT_642527 [Xylaria bambusicola]|uniref:uncharacterized protein n=1 Tax=Xylaria bambusicola TaxID=326684 RepID=UPI00200850CE|nr:uncharacterized protein F5B22DRAFT_642527 [Xylaria bambusicola]KAI0525514.1 hypothetical protein F5B22DRAFT_642527 [Xylaria bambusicola]
MSSTPQPTNNNPFLDTMDTELEVVSGPEVYQVVFRHLNCRRCPQSEDTPSCEAAMEWQYEPKDGISPDSHIALSLSKIARDLHHESEGYIAALQMEAYVVWNNSPPDTVRGEIRQSGLAQQTCNLDLPYQTHLDCRDLTLMQQRNCGDFILVEFRDSHIDEDERRGRMLRALTKLAKKASSHCNR